jgi:hypothetical protein
MLKLAKNERKKKIKQKALTDTYITVKVCERKCEEQKKDKIKSK